MGESICAGRRLRNTPPQAPAVAPTDGECPVERRPCPQFDRDCRTGCAWFRWGKRPYFMPPLDQPEEVTP